MRLPFTILVLTLAAAAPAAAQDAYLQHQIGVLEAELQLERQRSVALNNELNALSAQAQTERASQDLRRQQAPPIWMTGPEVPWLGAAPGLDTSGAPERVQIPDGRLADSRARVAAILERSR
ncbi:MAG: hypothetical protein Q7V15_09290 [Phenylobacterium sp.]|uniref:hypothetical protein n=1 Tax=Phenylobacterium sp. TaxID=1871053 RepID=UPI0027282C77|nr:hypothetical protein [Phenylobacterium sp.]MDO8901535.1 hypothetical protein [Phenylobacterium sp.]MDP2214645.1 hypothetical protein [Phenylobacterium sp.]